MRTVRHSGGGGFMGVGEKTHCPLEALLHCEDSPTTFGTLWLLGSVFLLSRPPAGSLLCIRHHVVMSMLRHRAEVHLFPGPGARKGSVQEDTGQTRLGSVRIGQLEGTLGVMGPNGARNCLQCVDNVWHKSCVLGILLHHDVINSQT